uniref:Calcineurin-like phosphoesterase domain-containing protein n=1 Tax=Ditylenchus dipsaci TaxID=166011 RepID=A0A915D138_9BILA
MSICKIFCVISLPALAVLFNEYLVYYLFLNKCSWPRVDNETTNVMVLADIHLLGVRRGYLVDKLRREWQMYIAFQTAMSLFSPQAVFFLGDLFDEGLWGDDATFSTYTRRFDSLFFTPKNTRRFFAVGNHDIGFHDEITPQLLKRFTTHFNIPNGVEHVELNNHIFVLINSMALEGDHCWLCSKAENEIDRFSQILNCTNTQNISCNSSLTIPYSRPILMQHFPLFRKSDESCEDSNDLAPPGIIEDQFRQKLDCLSENSTLYLIEKLKPRAAFGGHVHFGCRTSWKKPVSFVEYTVPSVSSRNNWSPSFHLVSIYSDQTLTCWSRRSRRFISPFICSKSYMVAPQKGTNVAVPVGAAPKLSCPPIEQKEDSEDKP